MKFLSAFATLSISAIVVLTGPAAASEGWIDNYEKALETAKKEKKDVLIDFTGSDWCGYCIKLDREVFSQAAFKNEAPKHFVLLELDFPRAKQLPAAVQAQNQRLQREFGVTGYPTIYLVDNEGRPYARTGYQPTSAEGYVKHLMELRKLRVDRDEHFAKAAKASGVERAKHLSAGLDMLDENVVYEKYTSVVDEIIELDAENAAGLKTRYEVGKEVRAIQSATVAALQTGADLAPVFKRIDEALKLSGDTGKSAQQLYSLRAQILISQDRTLTQHRDAFVAAVEKAVAADPGSQHGQQLAYVLGQLKAR